MQFMFSDQSVIKLEIENRKIAGKSLNIWKLDNILLNNPWSNKKSQKKLEYIFEDWAYRICNELDMRCGGKENNRNKKNTYMLLAWRVNGDVLY